MASEFLAPAMETFSMPAAVVDYENAKRERGRRKEGERDCEREREQKQNKRWNAQAARAPTNSSFSSRSEQIQSKVLII